MDVLQLCNRHPLWIDYYKPGDTERPTYPRFCIYFPIHDHMVSPKGNRAKDGTLSVMMITNTNGIGSLFIIKIWKILVMTIEQTAKSALFSWVFLTWSIWEWRRITTMYQKSIVLLPLECSLKGKHKECFISSSPDGHLLIYCRKK